MELKVLERRRERSLHSKYSELHLDDASTKDPTARSPHCFKEAKTNHRLATRFRPRRAGHMSDFKRGMFSRRYFYSWASRLVALAYVPSTQKNMAAHACSFRNFCEQCSLCTFPISLESISLYAAYLAAHRQTYGTILNHISNLKHFHQLAGYELTWSSDYRFTLLLRGVKRFLEHAVSRKSAIAPHILHGMFVLFDFSIPRHAAMWALFLVVFFTLLRKSNLVSDTPRDISSMVITRTDLFFLIRATKPFSFSSVLLHC